MMWDGVFSDFTPGFRSSEAEIVQAEAELGFALPASYRSFCRACGAGRACGHFVIATPLPFEEADLVARAALIAHAVQAAIRTLGETPLFADRPPQFAIEGGGDASIVERACFFGSGEAGEFLFWDVRPGSEEYDVWVLAADLETIRFGGATLPDFLRAVQGLAVIDILGDGPGPLPSTFEGRDFGDRDGAGSAAT